MINLIASYLKFILHLLIRFIIFVTLEIFAVVSILICICVSKYYKKFSGRLNKKPVLFFGPIPLINNKYYAEALRSNGYKVKTIMYGYFSKINSKTDFDSYVDEYLLGKLHNYFQSKYFDNVKSFFTFCKLIFEFDIFHLSFHGGVLGRTYLKEFEAQFLNFCGCKTVILGYGDDFYMYSKVLNKSWTHTLLIHYPYNAIKEKSIRKQVDYWSEYADCIINGMQIDGLGRWDVLPFRAECIDTDFWKKETPYSLADGKNGKVYVVHAPNHRFIKGTEFLIDAVNKLTKEENLDVELILLEGMQNIEVKKILESKADIFFDQLILGYAMSAIEAFSMGLPVITNLENEDYVRVFRRYSYLNECPALSASHENLIDSLRLLITNPDLRITLGKAGRDYAIKYHSFNTAKKLFGKVYDKIWFGDLNIDLLNFYHPLMDNSHNNSVAKINHPLFENKYVSK